MKPRLRGLVLATLLLSAACAPERQQAGAFAAAATASAPAPPAGLAPQLEALARGFDGRVGIAVEAVQEGWSADFDGAVPYPQQSVSKLCTAIAVLDAVDRGGLKLGEPVLVGRQDMSVFHQPIQARLTDQGLQTTIDELLAGAIAESDNAANDILIRRMGGPGQVQAAVDARRLGRIRCGPEERVLQSGIAGLAWRPEYSFGQAFWTARDELDPQWRADKLNAYLADPPDGAAPQALAHLLARLQRGELLSPASTAHLLEIMAATRTGPLRLPAGLGPGWSIAHKTGTGQDLGDLSTGNNDVGLMTAPDGRAYAVAVLIASTRRPVPDRQALMAAVARAVVAAHDGVSAPAPALTPSGAGPPAGPAAAAPPPRPG